MIPGSVLVFDIYGDFAQFRKYFTNMSPMSFSIPPRTVLSGIVGAILGIPKESNPETFSFNKSFFSMRIIQPVKKMEIPQNYLKTSGGMNDFYNIKEHKPTNIEYLKDVRYRIYCSHSEKHGALRTFLESHLSTYTICLGVSACIANYEYIGDFRIEKRESADYILLNSVVPMSSVQDIDFSDNVNLQKATVPIEMKNDRVVANYEDILYEQNGKAMRVKLKDSHLYLEGLEELIHEY